MPNVLREFRYAFRMMLRTPGFTAAAVLCLALGIGATTAIFSVVYAVVLRPLPYAEPGELVRVYTEFPTFPKGGLPKFWMSPPEFRELKRDAKSWEAFESYVNGGANLGANEPVRVTASFVTGGMLKMLGVAPAMGRVHTDQDDAPGAPLAAVISHGLWQRAFGGDRNVLGREAKLDGRGCTIVGVMPRGFQFPPGEPDPPEIWVPVQSGDNNRRGNHFLSVLARLKPGVTHPQAQQEFASLVRAAGETATEKVHSFHPKFHPVVSFPFQEEVTGGVHRAMMMLLGAVGLLLMIACVNVANLLLARAEQRQREIAVRKAIGASTGALARQFLIEGMLLSLAGGIGGVVLAFAGLRLILAASPNTIPRLAETGINAVVLATTLAVLVLTGVIFGLAPLAQLTAKSLTNALKAGAGRATASWQANLMRRGLAAVELALALMLLIGTGLMVRAFWKLQAVDIGVNPDRLLTMRIAMPPAGYDNKVLPAFWTRLQERIASVPGVESASLSSGLPPARRLNANDTQIEGFVPRPGGPVQNVDYYMVVGPRYFETMGIRLIEGRFFDERDGPGAPASIIINQSMARTFYPEGSPIGRRVRPSFTDPWRTIVGVVADVKNAGIEQPTGTELYLPAAQLLQGGLRSAAVIVRARSADPHSLAGPVRAEIAAMDSSLPIAQVRTLEDVIYTARSRPRFLTLLLALFSAVAVTLAAIGIYGVVSYWVAQRTNEFGVRMAMGAQPLDVLGLVLGQGMTVCVIGVVLGAAGASLLTRFIRGLLFGIDSFDPLTFAAMAVTLTAVTLLACFVPARRATRIDPMVALRYE